MKDSRYFKESEFRRCNPACSIEDMEQDALDMFDDIRRRAGIPMVLNCAYRSQEWDKAKGRSGNGAHTKGYAIDVRCVDSANKYKIVKAALECGCPRIGIYRTFVHLDCDPTLPQNIIWYGE